MTATSRWIPHTAGTHPRDAAWGLLAALLLYLPGVFPVFPPVGDAADYASLITHGVFDVRASHVGYYVFAYPFVTVGQWLGAPPTIVLNVLAAVCMAAAVGCANLLFQELGLGRRASALGTVALATCGIYWYHALFGELQALLMLLLIMSAWLFLARQPVAAGLLYGSSLLVTQAAAPWAVVFPVLAWHRRSWGAFWRCTAAGTLTFALGVLPVAREYFFGSRGVLPSLDYYQAASPAKTVLLFAYRLIENHLLVLPLVALGLAWTWRHDRRTLWLVAGLWAGHAWVSMRLGHIEYGFSWMPVYLGTAALAGAGASWMLERWPRAGRIGVGVALVGSAVLAWAWYVQPKRQDAITFAAASDAVGQRAGTATVVAWPHEGFVYINRRFPEVADVWASSWLQAPVTVEGWRALRGDGRELWILLHDVPTHPARQWLFANPIAARVLSAEARANYASEGSTEGDEMLAYLAEGTPPLVAAWPGVRLYRVPPGPIAPLPPTTP